MNDKTITRFTSPIKEMKSAFKLVQNKTDWKDSISSFCEEKEVELIRESVIFFTGTVPTFQLILAYLPEDLGRFKKNDTLYLVKAEGYRKGPCGDH